MSSFPFKQNVAPQMAKPCGSKTTQPYERSHMIGQSHRQSYQQPSYQQSQQPSYQRSQQPSYRQSLQQNTADQACVTMNKFCPLYTATVQSFELDIKYLCCTIGMVCNAACWGCKSLAANKQYWPKICNPDLICSPNNICDSVGDAFYVLTGLRNNMDATFAWFYQKKWYEKTAPFYGRNITRVEVKYPSYIPEGGCTPDNVEAMAEKAWDILRGLTEEIRERIKDLKTVSGCSAGSHSQYSQQPQQPSYHQPQYLQQNTTLPIEPVPMIIKDSRGVSFDTNIHGLNPEIYSDSNWPGPGFWNPNNTTINKDGFLELAIRKNAIQDGKSWANAEASTVQTCTYGDYYVTVQFTGGGAGDFVKDWNTTFGIYTYSPLKTAWPACAGNIAQEADLIEWGKSRDPKNPGVAQWGMQPWFVCNPNPPPTKDCCQHQGSDRLDSTRLPRWAELKQEDWNAIGSQNNIITFKMTWRPGSIQMWANPGDLDASNFPTTARWSYTSPPDSAMFVPVDNGTVHLRFNLWAPGVAPPNSPPAMIGPSDGVEKSVVVRRVVFPSGSASPTPTDGTESQKVACIALGKFCDLYVPWGQSVGNAIGTLCSNTQDTRNPLCWDCRYITAVTPVTWPKACDPKNPCTPQNVCELVGDAWYVLSSFRKNMDVTLGWLKDNKSASYRMFPRVDVVLPPAIQPGGVGCNPSNVGEIAQQALATLTAMSQEVGAAISDLFSASGCQ